MPPNGAADFLLEDDGRDSVSGSSVSESKTDSSSESESGWRAWRLVGPGLFVCLADTDAGCLVVAAESGARWGYSLLLLQVILIPVLFMAQELTVRLGVHTRKGHTACIREHFGCGWAWFACILLVLEVVGAMVTEMSGVTMVGELWGLSRLVATLGSAVLICGIAFSCNYRQIELVGVVFGLFELTFVLTMFCYHPSPYEVLVGSFTFHSDAEYISLITSNIGAVVMPWMIYFQQSAVVARRLVTAKDFREERMQTFWGSILTQLVMIGTLVTLAAARSRRMNLETVHDIIEALEPVLGGLLAKVLVSVGFLGGSLCAAFVVSLAAAWAVCEALGKDGAFSLDDSLTKAPHFYGCFSAVVLLGIAVLLMGVNIVKLNIVVELMDGILMPFTVGFLFILATGEALPPEARVTGCHKAALAVIFSLCTALSLVSAAYGFLG